MQMIQVVNRPGGEKLPRGSPLPAPDDVPGFQIGIFTLGPKRRQIIGTQTGKIVEQLLQRFSLVLL